MRRLLLWWRRFLWRNYVLVRLPDEEDFDTAQSLADIEQSLADVDPMEEEIFGTEEEIREFRQVYWDNEKWDWTDTRPVDYEEPQPYRIYHIPSKRYYDLMCEDGDPYEEPRLIRRMLEAGVRVVDWMPEN